MKQITSGFSALLLAASFSSGASAITKSNLVVSVFSAKQANVNAYVVSDDQGSLIIDATRSAKDAKELADFARSKGASPKMILITHGHPDHFIGLGVLKKEFPDARILVASKQIKADIIAMASMKWMDSEMRPKSEENQSGFDYQNEIAILDSNILKMPGGELFEVNADFPATEAAHETLLFSKELNAVFASDLAYNKVHLWLAGGVNAESIRNWQTELSRLKQKYGPLGAAIYPGHGEPTDVSVFDADIKYMNDLLTVVKESKTEDEAKKEMMRRYPDWKNADFILVQSIKSQTKLIAEPRGAR
jgi:glyoxylase-like metal-dependent hydrolase (beta-lactamase superfamily II)